LFCFLPAAGWSWNSGNYALETDSGLLINVERPGPDALDEL